MKKLKITFLILLTLVATLTLVGCGNGGNNAESNDVVFNIPQNLTVEEANVNWADLISVTYKGVAVDFSQVSVALVSGDPTKDATCTYKAVFTYEGTEYEQTFTVTINHANQPTVPAGDDTPTVPSGDDTPTTPEEGNLVLTDLVALTAEQKTLFEACLKADYSNCTAEESFYGYTFCYMNGVAEGTYYDEDEGGYVVSYTKKDGNNYSAYNGSTWEAIAEDDYLYYTLVFNFSLVDVSFVQYSAENSAYFISAEKLNIADFANFWNDSDTTYEYIWFEVDETNKVFSSVGLVDYDTTNNNKQYIDSCEFYNFGTTSFEIPEEVTVEEGSIQSALTAADDTVVTVTGTVMAASTRGYILYDGTGFIYVYANNGDKVLYAKGDYVTVTGPMGTYSATRQVVPTTSTKNTTGNNYTLTPTALTGSDVDAYVASSSCDCNYVTFTGVVTVDGNYSNVAVTGATKSISLNFITTEQQASFTNGDTITVTAYSIGQSKNTYYYVLVDTITGGTATTPDTPTPETPTYATSIVVGQAYKVMITQEGLKKDLYLNGKLNSSGYYFDTTETESEAITVYFEQTTGGYYMYTLDENNTKQYVDLFLNGTYINCRYTTTASCVWTWDATYNTVTTVIGTETYFVGNFSTIQEARGSKYSYLAGGSNYAIHFYEVK